jgi:hypothetical protein
MIPAYIGHNVQAKEHEKERKSIPKTAFLSPDESY